ncbi:MAG: nucleotidyltransferase domain-containing protein [Minisyncoccota bacterium]
MAEKWKKLLHRARLFSYVPFVEFVFVAGSMAMDKAREDSDFDVIVGARSGRIFTVRFFCIFLFGLFGWRRKKGASEEEAKDKFCFSHFVTQEKYLLSGPYNKYWQELYSSLVPIYGDKDLIQKFYDVNSTWIDFDHHYEACLRRQESATKRSIPRRLPRPFQSLAMTEKGQAKGIFEKILSGKLGDVIEKFLKKIQIKKIEKSLKTEAQYKPRIIFNDNELEFHPHTKRIEEFINNLKLN